MSPPVSPEAGGRGIPKPLEPVGARSKVKVKGNPHPKVKVNPIL